MFAAPALSWCSNGGAGLAKAKVFSPEATRMPHPGGETSLYEKRLVDIIVENKHRWERGEPFMHQAVWGVRDAFENGI
jgi:hypothetical protein